MYMKYTSVFWRLFHAMVMVINLPSIGNLRSEIKARRLPSSISDEITQYFTECPSFMDRFVNTCQTSSLSCNGKCGKPMTNIMMCSCEEFCKLRRDCCWDFEDHCPFLVKKISAETRKAFKSFNKTCENNFQIIEGKDVYGEGLHEKPLYIDFVVFDKQSGLSFRNENVFKMHRETLIKYNMTTVFNHTTVVTDNMSDQNLMAWQKQLFSNRSLPLDLEDMTQIFRQRQKIRGVEVMNVAPPFAEKCDQKLMMVCSNPFVDSEKCGNLGEVEVDKPEYYCQYFSSLLEDVGHFGCLAEFKRVQRVTDALRQVVHLSVIKNDVIEVINEDKGGNSTWFSVYLKNDPNTQQSEFSATCSHGRKFIFTRCLSPKHLVMVLGVAQSNSSFNVDLCFKRIVQFLNQQFQISIEDKWNPTNITNPHHPAKLYYYLVIGVQKYEFYFEHPRVQVSLLISDYLKENYGDNEIQDMTSCLGFDVYDNTLSAQDNKYRPNDNSPLKRSNTHSGKDDTHSDQGNTLPGNVFLLCNYIIQNTTYTYNTFNVTGMKELLKETVGTMEEAKTSDAYRYEAELKNSGDFYYCNVAGQWWH